MVRIIAVDHRSIDTNYQPQGHDLQPLADRQGCDICANRQNIAGWRTNPQGPWAYIFVCPDHAAATIALLEADVALGGLTSLAV